MNTKVKIGSKSKVVIKWDVMPIDYSHESENAIKAKFAEKYGHEPAVYNVVINDGAHKVC